MEHMRPAATDSLCSARQKGVEVDGDQEREVEDEDLVRLLLFSLNKEL